MQQLDVRHLLTTDEQLDEVYGEPLGRALTKEIDHINEAYRQFISRAPFVLVATAGPDGLDCSPRGDPGGVVRVVDEHTVMLPDRRGNNRIDTLRNIVRDGRVALLFMIPGIGETLRINGRAVISNDPELCEQFAMADKLPRSVLVVTAERVYFQCQKALARSGLWDSESHASRGDVPTAGQMLKSVDQGFDAAGYDAGYPEHMKKTIY